MVDGSFLSPTSLCPCCAIVAQYLIVVINFGNRVVGWMFLIGKKQVFHGISYVSKCRDSGLLIT